MKTHNTQKSTGGCYTFAELVGTDADQTKADIENVLARIKGGIMGMFQSKDSFTRSTPSSSPAAPSDGDRYERPEGSQTTR